MVHPINIDIDMESTSSMTTTIIFNKQTSITISAVHAHNLSSFLYSKFAPSQSFSSTFSFLSFSVGPDLAFALTPVDAVSHLLSPSLPCALFVVLVLPHSRPSPRFPLIALVPARICAHVRTPLTLFQLPIVIYHHPTHTSNNTPSCPVYFRFLCSFFQRTKHGKGTDA